MRVIGHARRLAPCFLTILLLFGADALLSAGLAQTPPPTPTPFHSPFNGDKDPAAGEAQDFGKLMDLYDAMKDAEAKFNAAEQCKSGIDDARKAFAAATAAFNTALARYIDDWSNYTYTKDYRDAHLPRTSQETIEKGMTYERDRASVMGELAKQDKKQHVAGNCPVTPNVPPPPPSTPIPSPPPPACTTKTQAEIDAEIAKAKEALLDTMKFLRKIEDAILKDQKDLKALQPRMGESYKTQLRDLTAKLEGDLHDRDVLEREKADELKKLGALQGQKPCPEGQTTPPPPTAPVPPPGKSGDSSNPDAREEIGAGPPPKKDQGFFGALLSHVHVSVGVGMSGHHGDGDHTDKPTSTKAPSDDDAHVPHD